MHTHTQIGLDCLSIAAFIYWYWIHQSVSTACDTMARMELLILFLLLLLPFLIFFCPNSSSPPSPDIFLHFVSFSFSFFSYLVLLFLPSPFFSELHFLSYPAPRPDLPLLLLFICLPFFVLLFFSLLLLFSLPFPSLPIFLPSISSFSYSSFFFFLFLALLFLFWFSFSFLLSFSFTCLFLSFFSFVFLSQCFTASFLISKACENTDNTLFFLSSCFLEGLF